MKNKKLATLILSLILVLGLLPMNAFADQRVVVQGSTASITVNGAVENDQLAAYKIIDIAYDATTNTVSYAWNSDFADYFAGTSVNEFADLESDSVDLKILISQLPQYIIDNNIRPVATQTVAADGNAVFADLAMGEYFIRPTSTTSVYQLMLQKLEPTVDDVNNVYVIDDLAFTAKHKEVTVDKTADKTSVTKGEKVKYTITVDVPTYAEQATDETFYVADLLPDGLTLDTDSIKVEINDATNDATFTVDEVNYTLDTAATDDYTFKLSVDKDQYGSFWSSHGSKKLVITYTATFNADDDKTAVNTEEINTVTFAYSSYPFDGESHEQKTATAKVTTFAIKIDKYKDGEEGTKLAGAKFDLYRTATDADIDVVTIPHTSIQGVKLEGDKETGEDGSATFEKYEANGNKYDYYLVETQAPAGYNILDYAIQVNFTDEDVKDTAGIKTVGVANSSGIKLPVTGGTGTVIFTVVGIALMFGAVILFVISRKKARG